MEDISDHLKLSILNIHQDVTINFNTLEHSPAAISLLWFLVIISNLTCGGENLLCFATCLRGLFFGSLLG